ncbi:uncharacterized protein LOC118459656 [Anopheles albimanus]|uniref:uncharacterized protein LOC118459656 n=1 Tax=Anopheles albimanus TaxID=7167 RepID=UPI00163E7956|nr:uncharacterized protein LOC118459656 [Anopheles albimanus]
MDRDDARDDEIKNSRSLSVTNTTASMWNLIARQLDREHRVRDLCLFSATIQPNSGEMKNEKPLRWNYNGRAKADGEIAKMLQSKMESFGNPQTSCRTCLLR